MINKEKRDHQQDRIQENKQREPAQAIGEKIDNFSHPVLNDK